jgi:mxaA protein
MKARFATALLILTWLAHSAQAPAQGVSVELQPPRAYGYFAGDIVRLTAVIVTGADARLNAASLPHPRTIQPWLDLRRVAVEEETTADDGHRYRLQLDYQLLDAPLESAERTVPPLTLKIDQPGGLADAVIPQWTLILSPLRGQLPGAGGLMPDITAGLPGTGERLRTMAATALAALLALMLLAYHHAWWPFRLRKSRPFTTAWREIRRPTVLPGKDAYRTSLLALHRAFDAAAGRRVFANDMTGFLDRHPQFRPADDGIAAFFAASRRAFFAGDLPGAEREHPLEAVLALSRDLSRLERQAA